VRFSGGIGTIVFQALKENLVYLNDYFLRSETLQSCANEIKKPSRMIYFLFRLVSICLAQKVLKSEQNEWLKRIHQMSELILESDQSNKGVLN
jgi:hypothetical protein